MSLPITRRAVAGLIPLLLTVLAPSLIYSQELEGSESWSALEELRQVLAASPQVADFVQIYQPAGFTTGDRETGTLYLALPDCARWDYQEPFPKIFLLCDSTIHTWNPGDQAGRRYLMVDADEPGIDLLRLRLDELRPRYEARIEKDSEGATDVVLSPKLPDSPISEARLSIDASSNLLRSISYRDLEGNVSRFEISGYRPLEVTAHFSPPEAIEWLDQ